jgi:hypothetical protein
MRLVHDVSNTHQEDWGLPKCALCGHVSRSMLGMARHLRVSHPRALAEYRESKGISPPTADKKGA